METDTPSVLQKKRRNKLIVFLKLLYEILVVSQIQTQFDTLNNFLKDIKNIIFFWTIPFLLFYFWRGEGVGEFKQKSQIPWVIVRNLGLKNKN